MRGFSWKKAQIWGIVEVILGIVLLIAALVYLSVWLSVILGVLVIIFGGLTIVHGKPKPAAPAEKKEEKK